METANVAQTGTATWQLDPMHSSVEFSVKHMMTTVRGRFKDITATLTAGIETGGVLVANKVRIEAEAQFVRQTR